MVSNKIRFCLGNLVVMLVLCFIASSAMAQFEIKLSIDDDADVSFADGNQVEYGDPNTDNPDLIIRIMSTKVINYHEGATLNTAAADPPVTSGTALGGDDFTIIPYNEFGGTLPLDLDANGENDIVFGL